MEQIAARALAAGAGIHGDGVKTGQGGPPAEQHQNVTDQLAATLVHQRPPLGPGNEVTKLAAAEAVELETAFLEGDERIEIRESGITNHDGGCSWATASAGVVDQ